MFEECTGHKVSGEPSFALMLFVLARKNGSPVIASTYSVDDDLTANAFTEATAMMLAEATFSAQAISFEISKALGQKQPDVFARIQRLAMLHLKEMHHDGTKFKFGDEIRGQEV